jgi:hypothetical protein
MDPKIQQWKEGLELITNDITDTIESLFVFKRLAEIVQANARINKDNLFWDHLTASFASILVLGVARQVDERTEVISLLKLLKDVRDNVSIVTRDWFADQYEPNLPRQIGEQHFAEHFGSATALDVTIVEKDIAELVSKTNTVARYRHTRIAHKNADKRLVIELKVSELEDALNAIEELVIKYQLLLNQAGFEKLMPEIHYDWEELLRTAWI